MSSTAPARVAIPRTSQSIVEEQERVEDDIVWSGARLNRHTPSTVPMTRVYSNDEERTAIEGLRRCIDFSDVDGGNNNDNSSESIVVDEAMKTAQTERHETVKILKQLNDKRRELLTIQHHLKSMKVDDFEAGDEERVAEFYQRVDELQKNHKDLEERLRGLASHAVDNNSSSSNNNNNDDDDDDVDDDKEDHIENIDGVDNVGDGGASSDTCRTNQEEEECNSREEVDAVVEDGDELSSSLRAMHGVLRMVAESSNTDNAEVQTENGFVSGAGQQANSGMMEIMRLLLNGVPDGVNDGDVNDTLSLMASLIPGETIARDNTLVLEEIEEDGDNVDALDGGEDESAVPVDDVDTATSTETEHERHQVELDEVRQMLANLIAQDGLEMGEVSNADLISLQRQMQEIEDLKHQQQLLHALHARRELEEMEAKKSELLGLQKQLEDLQIQQRNMLENERADNETLRCHVMASLTPHAETAASGKEQQFQDRTQTASSVLSSSPDVQAQSNRRPEYSADDEVEVLPDVFGQLVNDAGDLMSKKQLNALHEKHVQLQQLQSQLSTLRQLLAVAEHEKAPMESENADMANYPPQSDRAENSMSGYTPPFMPQSPTKRYEDEDEREYEVSLLRMLDQDLPRSPHPRAVSRNSNNCDIPSGGVDENDANFLEQLYHSALNDQSWRMAGDPDDNDIELSSPASRPYHRTPGHGRISRGERNDRNNDNDDSYLLRFDDAFDRGSRDLRSEFDHMHNLKLDIASDNARRTEMTNIDMNCEDVSDVLNNQKDIDNDVNVDDDADYPTEDEAAAFGERLKVLLNEIEISRQKQAFSALQEKSVSSVEQHCSTISPSRATWSFQYDQATSQQIRISQADPMDDDIDDDDRNYREEDMLHAPRSMTTDDKARLTRILDNSNISIDTCSDHAAVHPINENEPVSTRVPAALSPRPTRNGACSRDSLRTQKMAGQYSETLPPEQRASFFAEYFRHFGSETNGSDDPEALAAIFRPDGSHSGQNQRSSPRKRAIASPTQRTRTSPAPPSPVPSTDGAPPTSSACGVFESMKEMIYREVAIVIARNEERPHYLLALFRYLTAFDNDNLRQDLLSRMHEQLVYSDYNFEIGESKDDSINVNERDDDAERTPSETTIDSAEFDGAASQWKSFVLRDKTWSVENIDDEHDYRRETANSPYDFIEPVSSASSVLTSSGSLGGEHFGHSNPVLNESKSSNPSDDYFFEESGSDGDDHVNNFASDALGDTAVHLQEALDIIRLYENQLSPPFRQSSKQSDNDTANASLDTTLKNSMRIHPQSSLINKVMQNIDNRIISHDLGVFLDCVMKDTPGQIMDDKLIGYCCRLVISLIEAKAVEAGVRPEIDLVDVLPEVSDALRFCLEAYVRVRIRDFLPQILDDVSELLNHQSSTYCLQEEVDQSHLKEVTIINHTPKRIKSNSSTPKQYNTSSRNMICRSSLNSSSRGRGNNNDVNMKKLQKKVSKNRDDRVKDENTSFEANHIDIDSEKIESSPALAAQFRREQRQTENDFLRSLATTKPSNLVGDSDDLKPPSGRSHSPRSLLATSTNVATKSISPQSQQKVQPRKQKSSIQYLRTPHVTSHQSSTVRRSSPYEV